MEINKESVVQPRIAPSILNASERLKQDLSHIRLIAVHLEKGLGDSRGSVWIEGECEARAEEFAHVDLAVPTLSWPLLSTHTHVSFNSEQEGDGFVSSLPSHCVPYVLLLCVYF